MQQKAGMSYKEQLQYLKGLTVSTDVIHEAQTMQLRNYPIFIPGVKPQATTKIDVDNQIVYYECEKAKKGAKVRKKNFEAKCKVITQWVRAIIWDHTTVVVSVEGEVVFDSRA